MHLADRERALGSEVRVGAKARKMGKAACW